MPEMDLFSNLSGKECIHIASNTTIVISRVLWYKGELNYDCLVPQEDSKGKLIYCHATYSEQEIKILPRQ